MTWQIYAISNQCNTSKSIWPVLINWGYLVYVEWEEMVCTFQCLFHTLWWRIWSHSRKRSALFYVDIIPHGGEYDHIRGTVCTFLCLHHISWWRIWSHSRKWSSLFYVDIIPHGAPSGIQTHHPSTCPVHGSHQTAGALTHSATMTSYLMVENMSTFM